MKTDRLVSGSLNLASRVAFELIIFTLASSAFLYLVHERPHILAESDHARSLVSDLVVQRPKANCTPLQNVTLIRENATFETLRSFFQEKPGPTHVSCISVLEHVEPGTRRRMMQAINDHFEGSCFVATLEFHSKQVYFDHQLIPATLSAMFQPFTRLYLDEFCASPVWCENAIDAQPLHREAPPATSTPADIPRWYPIAMRFLRANLPAT